MTDRRAKITLNWHSAGAPARRLDDFVETERPALCARAIAKQSADAVNQARGLRDIVSRLENWARWCTSSEGGAAAACMTGAICETLRKAREGVQSGGSASSTSINTGDAVLIGRGMVRIDLDQRRLLGLHYVDGERGSYIAALLRFPRHDFDKRMASAQDALEAALARMSQNSDSK